MNGGKRTALPPGREFCHTLSVMNHRLCLSLLGLVAILAAFSGVAADVSDYTVIKSQNYVQPTNGAPTLLTTNGYGFACVVVGASNGLVLAASVKPPGTTPSRTLIGTTNGTLWQFTDATNTSAALDALYSSSFGSSYNFSILTVHDGLKSLSLNFNFISAPPTPQINNLPAAQDVNSSADFSLQWNALGGVAVIGQLTILDGGSNTVFSTPAPLQPGALSGSSTSVVIPAHTLPPDSQLMGLLTAAQPGFPGTSGYGTGIPALARITEFPLHTRSLVAPQLTLLPPDQTALRLRLTGATNANYELQTSTNLVEWSALFTTNSPTGTVEFSQPLGTGAAQVFYRGRAAP